MTLNVLTELRPRCQISNLNHKHYNVHRTMLRIALVMLVKISEEANNSSVLY